jgi:hypothetical protein
VGINSGGRNKHSDCSFFFTTVISRRKNRWYMVSQLLLEQNIWQTWLLVFLPTKLSVFLKQNILHQSKIYKNHFENSNFWGTWPLGHVGHVTYSFINMLFMSTGIFDDKLRPQILSVGTTANSPLRNESLNSDSQHFPSISTKRTTTSHLNPLDTKWLSHNSRLSLLFTFWKRFIWRKSTTKTSKILLSYIRRSK